MQKERLEGFNLIGIAVRTCNADGSAAKDIPALWERFMQEQIAAKIPNRVDGNVYSLYTNYEGDHNLPYDTVIGCKVSTLDTIPEGMVGHTFDAGLYETFEDRGNLLEGLVIGHWHRIWSMPLQRTYQADFEIYQESDTDPTDAAVKIFVGILDA